MQVSKNMIANEGIGSFYKVRRFGILCLVELIDTADCLYFSMNSDAFKYLYFKE